MRKPRAFGSFLTLVSGRSSKRIFVPQRALLISLIKQTIQRRNQTRSLLNTDLGIAGKGCAAGTARGPRGRCPGQSPHPAPRNRNPVCPLSASFHSWSCSSQAVSAFTSLGLLLLPTERLGCSPQLQRGRKSCWRSKARGARRGCGRAGLPLLRILTQVKRRAELTGSSYPRLLPAHPINHAPNEFVFTDEMFLAAETGRR